MKPTMQVGDLVKHKQGGWTGLIVRVEDAEGGHDPLYYLLCAAPYLERMWAEEIEIISESR